MLCVRTVLAFLTLQTFCIRTVFAVNKKLYKNIEDDVKKLKANKIKCSKADFRNILRLKCEDKFDKATLCIGEKLLTNDIGEYDHFWTLLGEIYHRQGKSSKGNKCFKEAAKLNGKFIGKIDLWHFIGPFQIGKTEIDGDPLEAFGGIDKLLCQKYNKDFQVYSELVPGGEVKWGTVKPNEHGVVTVVNRHAVVLDLKEVRHEWQGWLVGDFSLNSEMTVLIQCSRVSTIYINGSILAGDQYARSNYWHPIHLKPGVHSVLLRTRAVENMNFACRLIRADEAPLFQLHPPVTPDLVDGHIFSHLLTIPITNHNPTKWLTITKLTLVSQTEGPDISLHLDKQQRLTIAPGQIHSVIATFKFKDNNQKPDSCPSKEIQGILQLKSSEGLKGEISFSIRCRSRSESFLFTFIDHDGSLQNAAAIFPIVKEETGSLQIYPVLLTLHGSGAQAQNQADAYKREKNKKWLFGVEGMWTLAPTRHGAHNWEGPGELTAMTSLQKLAEFTHELDWINAKANSKAVVFAGHSMGGHGAWQLSTHHPDIALAVVSIAGWISKENYGESNLFFKYDISISHTDASVKHVMESCITENDAEKHVSNLKGIPVMIRIGENDMTVSPYFSKRMYRVLKGQGNNVTYTELPGKTHWWWDTYSTNDGGVVNDRDIRKFLLKHSKFAIERTSSPACSKNEDKTLCEDESTSKYSSIKVPNRNLAGSGEFLLTAYNPASSHGVRGVKVIQQATPFRKTTVRMKFSESNVTIVTSNVIRLRLTEPAISPVHWTERQVIFDGVEIPLDKNNENMFDLCKEGAKNWKLCEDVGDNFESEKQRGPLNLGPARRIAERPLLIVVGTSSQPETSQALLQMAVYIANTFYLTSDSIVPMIRGKDVVDENIRDHNLIIVGEISFTASYLEKVPLNFGEDQSISLGNCVFQSPDMGVLSLVPHSGSRLALVITGTSLSSIRDVLNLATPTIPPMARSPFSNLVPDYVITGPDFRAQGPGGYLCAGFWGNHWEYLGEISSCAC